MKLLEEVSHPTRVHALSVLTERPASAKELAAELDASVASVRRHLKKLEELDLITPVGKRSRETLYRATKEAWFDRESWKQLDPESKPGVTAAILGLIDQDITGAVVAGTLDGDENHISRTPMQLDRQGCDELLALLDSTLDRMLALRREAAERIDDAEPAIHTVVHLIQFDLPTVGSG